MCWLLAEDDVGKVNGLHLDSQVRNMCPIGISFIGIGDKPCDAQLPNGQRGANEEMTGLKTNL